LAKIIENDGAKGIAVGTPIAILAEEGDDLSKADALASESDKAAPPKSEAAKKESGAQDADPGKETKPGTASGQTTPALQTPSDQTEYGSGGGTEAPKAPAKPGQVDRPKFFASPLARKMALERGIPLADIKGTGPEGRIVKEDVEKYAGSGSGAASSATTTTPGKPAAAAPAEYEDIPLTNMRRTIGKRLLEAKQQIPHYQVTVEINMDRITKLREMFNKAGEGKTKLSVNDFIVKASALALAEVPDANSAWMGESIRKYARADICVAVATPNGLITPIIKDVGSKGLATISAETKALATRARDGKLKPEEYQGGTFTISNLGMFGVNEFNAIINPPQSCILAIGTTTQKLVLAPEEPKGFKAVSVMKATLSSDHRTVDGAVAARWIKAFKEYMEQPLTFML